MAESQSACNDGEHNRGTANEFECELFLGRCTRIIVVGPQLQTELALGRRPVVTNGIRMRSTTANLIMRLKLSSACRTRLTGAHDMRAPHVRTRTPCAKNYINGPVRDVEQRISSKIVQIRCLGGDELPTTATQKWELKKEELLGHRELKEPQVQTRSCTKGLNTLS